MTDEDVTPGNHLYEQAFALWITPEIEHRVRMGTMTPPVELAAAQILFHIGRPVEVRLNHEVKAKAQFRVNRSIEQGEKITVADIQEVVSSELTEEDPDAAHVTMIWLDGKCNISFNFHYNRNKAKNLVAAAQEYLASVKNALENRQSRVFVDNLYSAVELAAKARLILMPNPTTLTAKSHNYVQAEFNRFGKLGNAPDSHVILLNRLANIRSDAKYSTDVFALDSQEAAEMLACAEDMVTGIHALVRRE